jgi:DNA-binding NarL/FixJ family response regulator
MGWSQMQRTPVALGPPCPGAGRSHEFPDERGIFAEARKLRTVFVMDDELLRHGLIHIVSQADRVQLVGELTHSAELAVRLKELQPELLVVGVDRSLPLATLLAELEPAPKVVVVMDDACAPAQAIDLIKAGADALVHRRSPSTDLLRAVQRVIEGQAALDAFSADALIAELRVPAVESDSDCSRILTRREHEVLLLLTEGHDNRTIAAKLFIAETTVKFHLHNIMDKFGVHKRAALVSAALRGNLGGQLSLTQHG